MKHRQLPALTGPRFLTALLICAASLAPIAEGRHPAVAVLPPPILAADQPWERGSLAEPVPLRWHGRSLLLYSAGWDRGAIGAAWSPDGARWTKHRGPVFGLGGSGYAGLAAEPAVAVDGDTLILYYADQPTGDLHAATSRDGVHWTRRAAPVLRRSGAYTGIANTAVARDGRGWAMVFESMTPSGVWRMGIAIGPDPFRWRVAAWPLRDLDLGGAYGGPWLTRQGTTWRLLYHASRGGDLGTDLYASASADLRRWTTPALYLGRPAVAGVDQVADPSLLGTRIIYSVCDNAQGWCALHAR